MNIQPILNPWTTEHPASACYFPHNCISKNVTCPSLRTSLAHLFCDLMTLIWKSTKLPVTGHWISSLFGQSLPHNISLRWLLHQPRQTLWQTERFLSLLLPIVNSAGLLLAPVILPERVALSHGSVTFSALSPDSFSILSGFLWIGLRAWWTTVRMNGDVGTVHGNGFSRQREACWEADTYLVSIPLENSSILTSWEFWHSCWVWLEGNAVSSSYLMKRFKKAETSRGLKPFRDTHPRIYPVTFTEVWGPLVLTTSSTPSPFCWLNPFEFD